MGGGLRRAPALPHVPLRDGANGCFEFGRIGGPQPLGFLRRETAGGQHLVQLPEDAIAVRQPLMRRRIAQGFLTLYWGARKIPARRLHQDLLEQRANYWTASGLMTAALVGDRLNEPDAR